VRRGIITGLSVLLAGVAACSGSTSSSSARTGRRVQTAAGWSIVVPSGWRVDRDDPTQLRVFDPQRFIDENCQHAADFTSVVVTIQVQDHPNPSVDPAAARPSTFAPSTGTPRLTGDDLHCDSSIQSWQFTSRGRYLDAFAVFGRDASAKSQATAYAILNSLQPNRT
jgi:hypothetical protein